MANQPKALSFCFAESLAGCHTVVSRMCGLPCKSQAILGNNNQKSAFVPIRTLHRLKLVFYPFCIIYTIKKCFAVIFGTFCIKPTNKIYKSFTFCKFPQFVLGQSGIRIHIVCNSDIRLCLFDFPDQFQNHPEHITVPSCHLHRIE